MYKFLFLLLWLPNVLIGQTQVSVSGNIFNTKQDSIMISKYYGGTKYVDYISIPQAECCPGQRSVKLSFTIFVFLKIFFSYLVLVHTFLLLFMFDYDE